MIAFAVFRWKDNNMKPFYEIGDIYYLPVRTYVIMIYFISCESSHVPSLHFSTYLLLLRLHLYFRIILFFKYLDSYWWNAEKKNAQRSYVVPISIWVPVWVILVLAINHTEWCRHLRSTIGEYSIKKQRRSSSKFATKTSECFC